MRLGLFSKQLQEDVEAHCRKEGIKPKKGVTFPIEILPRDLQLRMFSEYRKMKDEDGRVIEEALGLREPEFSIDSVLSYNVKFDEDED